MPDGQSFYINPIDINDLDGRKISMCAYGKEATPSLFGGGAYLDSIIHAEDLERPFIFWPILKADPSFLEKIYIPIMGIRDESDLNYLLTLDGNNLAQVLASSYVTHFDYPAGDVSQPNEIESAVVEFNQNQNTWLPASLTPQIQEMILPCDIK
jgi:hypothetical protein